MADSYLGFLHTTIPAQIGDLVPPPAAEAPYPTQVLTQSGNVIQMAPGSTTPSSVNIQSMPVIVSLLNKTTDIEYAGNTTTITGNLEVDEDIIATGDVTGQDIMATNNISAITANLQGIRINPHNTAPFTNNIVLNQNIQVGVSDNGTYNALDAPDIELYPKNFSIGGLVPPYPARTIELVGIEIPITATVNMNIAAPLLTIEAVDTNFIGIVSVEGDVNVVGILGVEGDANVAGLLTVEGEANVTGAMTVEGAGNITGGLAVEGGANIAGVVGLEGATTVTGPFTVVGLTSTAGFGTLIPPAPINSFTVVSAGPASITASALNVAAIESIFTGGLRQTGVGSINFGGQLNVTDISGVATINGAAYPPSNASTWSQYAATSTVTIPSQYTLLTNTLQGNGNAGTSTINVNSPLNMGNLTLTTTSKISSLNAAGFQIEANNLSITGYNNAPALVTFNNAALTGVNTINGVAYPPPAQTPSGWALYPAIQTVTIPNPYGLNTNRIGTATPSGSLNITGNPVNFVNSPITGVTTINGAAYPPPGTNVSTWSTYKATQTVDMSGNALINVSTINGASYPPAVPTILSSFTPVWTVGQSQTGTLLAIPNGAVSFDMIMIGGGGGGGGSAGFLNNAGGGGGSGFIRTALGIRTAGYTNYSYVVGSGGVGGTPGNQGAGGTQTTFALINNISPTPPLTITWVANGGYGGGGATGGVNDGGGPGGLGGAGGGGGWRRQGGGAAGGGAGQWNGTQQDDGGSGGLSTSDVTGGTGGANQWGSLAVYWPGTPGGFDATGGIGGGHGGGYQTGVQSATCGIAIPGDGGGGGGQNADSSGGQGGNLGGGYGAVGNIWLRWYYQ